MKEHENHAIQTNQTDTRPGLMQTVREHKRTAGVILAGAALAMVGTHVSDTAHKAVFGHSMHDEPTISGNPFSPDWVDAPLHQTVDNVKHQVENLGDTVAGNQHK